MLCALGFRALDRSSPDGVPGHPRAWLTSTGRFKAIDAIRRRARLDASFGVLADRLDADASDAAAELDDEKFEDDLLRLIFTCCHPAFSPETQVARS